ncbi:hypothetical protein [Prochlorothrix hollandica]|uniref:hypothetical protein n=1 Tax=Prochlorothrix hollandica TaxID=1223 RepID=UPI0011D1E7E1|nr:hypothetical protein [Prochlorothrix hollandica]
MVGYGLLHCTATVPSLYRHGTVTIPPRYRHYTATVSPLYRHPSIAHELLSKSKLNPRYVEDPSSF